MSSYRPVTDAEYAPLLHKEQVALRGKIRRKIRSAGDKGLLFYLSFDDVLRLLKKAGIRPADWRYDGYHLSRFEDKGNYSVGNCRFITAKENRAEQKISDNNREASRKNVILCQMGRDRQTHEQRVINGIKAAQTRKLLGIATCPPLSAEETLRRFEKVKHIDFSVRGCWKKVASILKMSQSGVGWIRGKWINTGLLESGKIYLAHRNLSNDFFDDKFQIVRDVNFNKIGAINEAASLLGVSRVTARKYKSRWVSMGLIPIYNKKENKDV